MKRRSGALALGALLVLAGGGGCARGQTVPQSRQHLVAIAEDSAATTGRLLRYQWNDGKWSLVGEPIPVVFGFGGVGPKQEGDGRSPQGVFSLGRAFGYSGEAPPGTNLPYEGMEPTSVCVDDAESTVYNRILNPPPDGGAEYESAERMRRDLAFGDGLYEIGVVVDYNPRGSRDPVTGRGRGSCIFLHVWRDPTSPTAGCTAMSRDRLLDVLAWLDPAQLPTLIQGTPTFLDDLVREGALPYQPTSSSSHD